MAWIYLVIAGALEIVWALAMKQSHGFTRLVPSIVTIIGIVFLGEQISAMRIGAAVLIVSGLVLMKLSSS